MHNLQIKIGIAGYGERGKIFTRRLRELDILKNIYKLIGVYDIDQKKRQELYENCPYLNFYENLEKMLNDVDAIIDATSTEAHFRTTSAALKFGKHVLVEKPPALNLKEHEELENLAKKNDLVCFVGYTELFNPAVQYILKLDPKDFKSVRTMRFGPKPVHRKSDQGIIVDLISHDIQNLNTWTKETPEIIFVEEHEEEGFLRLKYKNFRASLHGLRIEGSEYRDRTLELYAKNKKYIVDYALQNIKLIEPPDGGPLDPKLFPQLKWAHQIKLSENIENTIRLERKEPLEALLIEFAKSIKSGKNSENIPTISNTKETTKIIENAKNMIKNR